MFKTCFFGTHYLYTQGYGQAPIMLKESPSMIIIVLLVNKSYYIGSSFFIMYVKNFLLSEKALL